jgi:hypothetical protein
MKVSDLKYALEFVDDNFEVVVRIKLPYSTVGGSPRVVVENAYKGFDWDDGKFFLIPEEDLTPTDRDFAKQMKDMQDKLGWSEYENRGLKAEIKRLKKQLKGE